MKIWDKNNTLFSMLFFYCVFWAYFSPGTISFVAWFPLLIFFWRSRSNAIWIAFLIVLLGQPANFFAGGNIDDVGRIPYFSITRGFTFTFLDFFLVLLVIKATSKCPRVKLIYSKELHIVGFVFLFAFMISFLFTIGKDDLILFIRQLLILIQIVFLPRLLFSEKEWFSLFQLLYPITILTFIDQLNVFITGFPLSTLIGGTDKLYHAMTSVAVDGSYTSRAISGVIINFVCFTSALTFISSQRRIFRNRFYLYTIVAVCYLQILLSATRGWFLAYTIMISFFFIWSQKRKILKSFVPLITGAVVIFFVMQSSAILKTQTRNAWKRIATVEQVIEGDITAGGTLGRLNYRLPRLVKHIKKSPIVGYGFSRDATVYLDTHVGFLSPIIHFGIVGYIILLWFIFNHILVLYRAQKYLSNTSPYHGMLKVGIIAFIGLFIIHVTSRQIFGVNYVNHINILQVFAFVFTNWIILFAFDHKERAIEMRY